MPQHSMKQITIDPKRLDQVMSWSLKPGMHYENLDGNACLMEAVCYLAGETWNDRPRCVCPVLTEFVDYWEAVIRDEDRDPLLKPLMPRLVGTKSSASVELRRAYMVLDWLIRVHTATFLELVPALASHAQALRNASEITDVASATAAGELVRRAGEAAADAQDTVVVSEEASRAWIAAWECAGDAARFTAGGNTLELPEDFFGAAAGAIAWEAGWKATTNAGTVFAWPAAEAAALAAPKDESGDPAAFAAWDAAVKVLAPTVDSLLPSALDLIDRMMDVREPTAHPPTDRK